MTDSMDPDTGISPTLPTELAVSRIWSEVLQIPCVKPEDNFFTLGGDSLLMMIVLFRITESLSVDLPPGVLLESPTLTQFCELIDTARQDAKGQSSPG
jgi:hypothetical protein